MGVELKGQIGELARTAPLEYLKVIDTDPRVRLMWEHFFGMSGIPSPSGDEGKMRNYIKEKAQQYNLNHYTDTKGNLLVLMPATKGFEDKPGLIFQGHMDMYCTGEPDPAKYGVEPAIDKTGQWVKSKNRTTLAADNRTGLSALLSLMEDPAPHGKVGLLLTVEEETSLKGALAMDFDEALLAGFKYLVNVDHEPEADGEAIIESAGAGDTIISIPVEREEVGGKPVYKIEIDGLPGGHSGIDIDKGRLNAIKLLGSAMQGLQLMEGLRFRLVRAEGGQARNGIPLQAAASLVFETQPDMTLIDGALNHLMDLIQDGLSNEQKEKMRLTFSRVAGEKLMLDSGSTKKVIHLINLLKSGVIRHDLQEGTVEVSTNVGTLRTMDQHLELGIMTRAVNVEDIINHQRLVSGEIVFLNRDITTENFIKTEHFDPYSGYCSPIQSQINTICSNAWKNTVGERLKFGRIHAGLDNGVIVGRYPKLDLQTIAIGCHITGAHSDTEQVEILSANKMRKFLSAIVAEVVA